jgi:hypothetical protein
MNLLVLLDPPRLYTGIKRRLRQRRLMYQTLRRGRRLIGADPNIRPEVVPTFLASRPSEKYDDRPVLERIIRAYQKAKADQKHAGEAFHVTNEWRPIYERNLGPVMKALQSGDLSSLERMYRNFYRDPCRTGLVGVPIKIRNLFSGGSIKQKFREYIICDIQHAITYGRNAPGASIRQAYSPHSL